MRLCGVFWILACCVGWAWAVTAEAPPPPALAVLVHAEAGGEALAEPFRALLEVETSRTWEGGLLERAELATVLQEMKLSNLLGDAGAAGVQTGKMARAADLVLARVYADKVSVTVTGFPKTDILFEKTYTDRLEPESLATRVTVDVLTALRTHVRDPKTSNISIGVFSLWQFVNPRLIF